MTLYRTILAIVAILFSISVQAQNPGWLRDLKLAQSLAQDNKKLILVDFWASWCGPCKQMDADVWSTQQASVLKQNFVPVKIDIDVERSLANQYNVKTIPMLILMDYRGEVLYIYNGYSGKEKLLNFISHIPANAASLYENLPSDQSKETFEQALGLGMAMQELSQQTDYEPLQRSFLIQSDKWFNRSIKLTTDENKINGIELLALLNDVYRNSSKKVIKEIEENRVRYETQSTQSLMYFLLVKVYKKNGDTTAYEYALSKLKEHDSDKKYLSLLD